jgi:RimJ/RimL family protein N-acetyltransferase
VERYPIAVGQNVLLCDSIVSDVPKHLYWMTHGEWREYDAPWEQIRTPLAKEQKGQIVDKFMKRFSEQPSVPRKGATIVHQDNPVGYVTRYGRERYPEVMYVGIGIREDGYLNMGLGTEALRLWVDYLFINSTIHKIGLDTWSLNPRMIRVAEKSGFVREGMERHLIQWQGQWLDGIHFGMLRHEWEERLTKQ